jgi:hypothetical protein
VGDASVAETLERILNGRAIDGHELAVQVRTRDAPMTACHLLYVSAGEMRHAPELLAGLKNAPILTVSDADRFVESGGVAQLIVDSDRIRFAVNTSAAERAHLRLSSKLLSLARIVADQP